MTVIAVPIMVSFTLPWGCAYDAAVVALEPSDHELLMLYADGDDGAFDQLVRRHQQWMWRLALRVLRDQEDAADAVQEAFIAALRGVAGFRGDAKVTTWLHQITLNCSLRRLRQKAASPTTSSDPERDVPAIGNHHADRELRIDIDSALDRLPDDQRQAIVLVDVMDLPLAQVSDLLGVPVGTVKSRCARGRARLAILLGYLQTDHPGAPRRPSNVRSARSPEAQQ